MCHHLRATVVVAKDEADKSGNLAVLGPPRMIGTLSKAHGGVEWQVVGDRSHVDLGRKREP